MRGDPSKRLKTNDWRLLASICGVSDRTLRDWRKAPTFPSSDGGAVCVAEVVLWAATVDGSADMEAAGGDSPALEAYRWARAGQEQLKLSAMQGEHLPTEWVEGFVGELCRTVRSAGEVMERAGNERGANVLRESLESMERRVETAVAAGNFALRGLQDDFERDGHAERTDANELSAAGL